MKKLILVVMACIGTLIMDDNSQLCGQTIDSTWSVPMSADSLRALRMAADTMVPAITITNPDMIWGKNQYDFWWLAIPLFTQVPNCANLYKRDSLFYPRGDSVPYCGTCVVLHGELRPDTVTCLSAAGEESPSSFILINGEKVKIISHYDRGKRHGSRQYFDPTGRLIKTEYYEQGKLISTTYAD